MAKKPTINKTQAVREYLKDHPGAKSGEIATALTRQGVKITANYVSNIKTTLNKEAATKTATKKPAAAVAEAPAAGEKPAKNGSTITLEQVKKVAQTIKTIGGYQRVLDVLEVIKELGGVKKFKDLAEAMTITEAEPIAETDGIPF